MDRRKWMGGVEREQTMGRRKGSRGEAVIVKELLTKKHGKE
jgi:hypothetical protein